MELRPNFKISEEECREAFRLWLDADKYNALTKEQRHSVDVLMDAELAHEKLRRWPITVQEVYDCWEQRKTEADARRARQMAYAKNCSGKQEVTVI
jgi:hypothetical protein